jgi:hypothetical protein
MGLNKDRRVTASINGVGEGVWDKMSEKKVTASPKKYYPGGGRTVPPINLGNTPVIEDLTLERGIDTGVAPGKLKEWMGMVGKQVPMHATDIHVDPEGNVIDEGLTAIGEITGAWETGADSESDDETMVAVSMSVVAFV